MSDDDKTTKWHPIDTAPHVQLVQIYGPVAGGGGRRVGVGMWCQAWGGWWTCSINGKMKTCHIEPELWAPMLPAPEVKND